MQHCKLLYFVAFSFQIEQKVGQWVWTWPRANHGGFNNGFNVAVANNIAFENWLPIGATAKICKCPDIIRFNLYDILRAHGLLELAEQWKKRNSDFFPKMKTKKGAKTENKKSFFFS